MSETSPGGLSCQRARVSLYSRSIRTVSRKGAVQRESVTQRELDPGSPDTNHNTNRWDQMRQVGAISFLPTHSKTGRKPVPPPPLGSSCTCSEVAELLNAHISTLSWHLDVVFFHGDDLGSNPVGDAKPFIEFTGFSLAVPISQWVFQVTAARASRVPERPQRSVGPVDPACFTWALAIHTFLLRESVCENVPSRAVAALGACPPHRGSAESLISTNGGQRPGLSKLGF